MRVLVPDLKSVMKAGAGLVEAAAEEITINIW